MISIAGDFEHLIQPASIDCPVGDHAYRMYASSVPQETESVEEVLKGAAYDFILRPEGTFLEKGVCHILPLAIDLSLSPSFYGEFSPKSTVGRNDVFVRVITDRWTRFDTTPNGYTGKLYLEVTPLSYPVRVSPGLCLTQMRIKEGNERYSDAELEKLHAQYGIVRDNDGCPLDHKRIEIRHNGVFLHVDLSTSIVGFEALAHPAQEVNLSLKDSYVPKDFWLPIRRNGRNTHVLSPGRFYLLRTKERVIIPPQCCAWMQPYDVGSGEFRSHYAGFFDNGFGGEFGTAGVLEVRVRDVPFRVYDGQPICHLVFEKTDEVPRKLYSRELGSYTQTGPSLAKNFKDRYEAWVEEYWR